MTHLDTFSYIACLEMEAAMFVCEADYCRNVEFRFDDVSWLGHFTNGVAIINARQSNLMEGHVRKVR